MASSARTALALPVGVALGVTAQATTRVDNRVTVRAAGFIACGWRWWERTSSMVQARVRAKPVFCRLTRMRCHRLVLLIVAVVLPAWAQAPTPYAQRVDVPQLTAL